MADDMERTGGLTIQVHSCTDHGAHVVLEVSGVDGEPVAIAQVTEDDAFQVARDLITAAGRARLEIAQWKAGKN